MDAPLETETRSPSPADGAPPETDALKLALRRARFENAERSGARAELRAARLGRLELLQDALQPVLAQIPSDVDMFDVALVPSASPRLFIDMIGFVEMGRDAHAYVLQQDTRHGRIKVAETGSLDAMVDAVTDYVARRLLERDKALASDAKARSTDQWVTARNGATLPSSGHAGRRPGAGRWVALGFAFLIDLLGTVAFFAICGLFAWLVWSRLHVPT